MEAIVGSQALAYFGFNRTKPKDIDIWYSDNEFKPGHVDSTIMPSDVFNLLDIVDGYCTPNSIYTIKCSHLGWDIHWEKTKNDILWLHSKGCVLKEDLYNRLVKHWKEINGNKDFLSLSRDKRDFFNDHVTYIYDHDYLHEVVAYPNEPIYKKCLKQYEEVLLDKRLFDQLSFEDKIRMFREEISAIAIERWLVNPKWKDVFSTSQAYSLALKKTIISLTKNWATDFIVQNLDKFYKVDLSYFKYATKIGLYEMKKLSVLKEFLDDFNKATDDKYDEAEFVSFLTHNEFYKEAEEWADSVGYELLEQDGGGEGGSEWCHSVFKLNNKTFKITYNYYSHNGFDYDYAEATEVKAVTKTVTVYE